METLLARTVVTCHTVNSFDELSDVIDKLNGLMGQKVLGYCTRLGAESQKYGNGSALIKINHKEKQSTYYNVSNYLVNQCLSWIIDSDIYSILSIVPAQPLVFMDTPNKEHEKLFTVTVQTFHKDKAGNIVKPPLPGRDAMVFTPEFAKHFFMDSLPF